MQDRIADRFPFEPFDTERMQVLIGRVEGASLPEFGTELRRYASVENECADQLLGTPAVLDEIQSQIIQKFRVGRSLAEDAEVIGRCDDSSAEEVVPDPVDVDPGNESPLFRADELLCEFQTTTAGIVRKLRWSGASLGDCDAA